MAAKLLYLLNFAVVMNLFVEASDLLIQYQR